MKKKSILASISAKHLVIGVAIIILFFILYYSYRPLIPKLQINNQVFTTELAITDAEKQQGLSGRTELKQNHGMLFVYQSKGRYSFWMHDMLIPLDFIWIDNNRIVDLDEHVEPPTVTGRVMTIEPNEPVDRVFEVPSGTIQKYNIKVGDTVTYLRK